MSAFAPVLCLFALPAVIRLDAPGRGPTAGIQQALDAAAAKGGDRVVLGPGRYVVSATIRVPSNCVLEGSGPATVIIATAPIGRQAPPWNRVISNAHPEQGDENILVRDLAVDGAGIGTYHKHAIYGVNLSNCRDCLLERLWVRNTTGEGILVNYGGGKVVVHQCTVVACNHGINVHHRGVGDPPTETAVIGNTVRNCRCIGIFCEAASNMLIANNLVTDNGWAGIVWMGGADEAKGIRYPARRVTISDNLCLRNGSQGGIFINGTYAATEQFVVSANVCQGNGRDGIWALSARDGIISANLCADNNIPADGKKLADWQASASGIRLVNCQDVAIVANRCLDTRPGKWQMYGIRVEGPGSRGIVAVGNVAIGNRREDISIPPSAAGPH